MTGDPRPQPNQGSAAKVRERRPFHGLTDEDRQALSDSLSTIVLYFADAITVARNERDAALVRAEKAERWVKRMTRPDGAVLDTKVSP